MSTHRHLIALLFSLAAGAASAGDIVVIANPAAGPLTKEQVADIFLGKDVSRTPVDQMESSPVYAEFYMKATGRDVAQVKTAWSKLVFTGKARAPKQLPDSAAVKKAVAADPKAIAYVEKADLDDTVKAVLTLDK